MIKPPASSRSSSVWTAAILVGVIALLYFAREILIPLSFAITLTLILAPAVAWLQKARLGRTPAVLLVMMISIAAGGAVSLVIFNELIDVVNQLPKYQDNIHNKIQAMHAPSKGAFGRAAASVQDLVKQLSNAHSSRLSEY
jgi:predicted PurR-regulated permease PerM